MPDDLLTTYEAAKRLKVSRRQVQYLIKQGVLPAQKLGRDYVVRAADVDALPPRKPGPVPRNREED